MTHTDVVWLLKIGAVGLALFAVVNVVEILVRWWGGEEWLP